jgi:hypothetical protein
MAGEDIGAVVKADIASVGIKDQLILIVKEAEENVAVAHGRSLVVRHTVLHISVDLVKVPRILGRAVVKMAVILRGILGGGIGWLTVAGDKAQGEEKKQDKEQTKGVFHSISSALYALY